MMNSLLFLFSLSFACPALSGRGFRHLALNWGPQEARLGEAGDPAATVFKVVDSVVGGFSGFVVAESAGGQVLSFTWVNSTRENEIRGQISTISDIIWAKVFLSAGGVELEDGIWEIGFSSRICDNGARISIVQDVVPKKPPVATTAANMANIVCPKLDWRQRLLIRIKVPFLAP